MNLTLRDVDIVSWKAIKGRQGRVHVDAMLEKHIVRPDIQTLLGKWDQLTDVSTVLRAESSASMRSFSCIRSTMDSLDRSRGTPPDVGPEGTVGAWMLSFMGIPIP